jgi:vacuolar-type H+-ATPase subunit C/Vma6
VIISPRTSAPKIITVLSYVLFAMRNTQLTTKDAQFTKLLSKKQFQKLLQSKTDSNALSKTKSYAETTKNQNSFIEHKIADTLSSLISNLKSLISPLISLLSTVLKALTTNSSI